MKKTSAISDFHEMSIEERIEALRDFYGLNKRETKILRSLSTLGYDDLTAIGENPVSTWELPLRFANYFKINEVDYFIPMVTEEASVVAGACYGAKLCYNNEGVKACRIIKNKLKNKRYKYGMAKGQVQLIHVGDSEKAKKDILENKDYLLRKATELSESEWSRATDLKVKEFDSQLGKMLVVDLYIDPGDAMGAGAANRMAEAIAPELTKLTGYPYNGRIVSNYSGRLTEARVKIPVKDLARRTKSGKWTGEQVRDRILWLDAWAREDFDRTLTHNKGIFNGVNAVALATAQDTRAIEKANEAFARFGGWYKPLSRWYAEDDFLIGELRMLIPCGIVGGEIKKYPKAEFLLRRILKVKSADQLAEIMASVGLVQNLAALDMLATIGVTEGHELLR